MADIITTPAYRMCDLLSFVADLDSITYEGHVKIAARLLQLDGDEYADARARVLELGKQTGGRYEDAMAILTGDATTCHVCQHQWVPDEDGEHYDDEGDAYVICPACQNRMWINRDEEKGSNLTADGIIVAFLNRLLEKDGVVIPDDDVSAAVSEAVAETFEELGLEPGEVLGRVEA